MQNLLIRSSDVYIADKWAGENGIPVKKLMENAGKAVARFVKDKFPKSKKILVVCGKGNNGGDGRIAAKYLKKWGYGVEVLDIVKITPHLTFPRKLEEEGYRDKLSTLVKKSDIIIDAIFGVGISRNIIGNIKKIIGEINHSGKIVVAVDVPSGICADSGKIYGTAVKANYTISLFHAKVGQYLLPAKEYCGKIIVKDIGIPETVYSRIKASVFLNDRSLWQKFLPKNKLSDNKYSRGTLLINGSGIDCTGATKLAAMAAARIGTGLVTVACDEKALPVYAKFFMAVMAKPIKKLPDFLNYIDKRKINTVLIGPGNGVNKDTKEKVLAVLKRKELKVILDADAISSFKDDPEELISRLHENCILTPHEGEFKRLFGGFPHLTSPASVGGTQRKPLPPPAGGVGGRNRPGFSKLERALSAAKKSGAVIVLKGNDTVIANPDGMAVINGDAPATLATAGTGDVLAGIIAGLCARGMPCFDAACAGVYIHSQTAKNLGENMIADDLARETRIYS